MKTILRAIPVAVAALAFSASAAHALPVLGVLLAAAAGAAATFAVTGSIIAAIAVGIAYAGLSYLSQSVGGKPKVPDAVQSYSKMQTGGVVPQSFIAGTWPTPGSLVYFNYWGQDGKTPNAYESRVVALSDLPSTDLVGLIVDGNVCTYGSGTPDSSLGYAIPEYDKDGSHYLWVKFYDGTQTTADSFLVGKFGGDAYRPYASTRVGTGRTYVVVTIRHNDQNLSSSSSMKFIVKGAKFYDPRLDSTVGGSGSMSFDDSSTYEYSENPQVFRYNIRRGIYYGRTPSSDGQWMMGIQGMSAARLPYDNWSAAFNDCDTLVDNHSGGTEKQYRFAGEFAVNTEPATIDESLMRACNARSIEVGGIYKTTTGAPGSPVRDYTDSDFLITSPQRFDPYPGLSGTVNGVNARFPDPSQLWQTTDAPSRIDEVLQTEDGGRQLLADVNYDCVPFPEQVQRLMISALAEERRWRLHTNVLPHTEWQREPGDIVTWTSSKNGYDNKQFRIESIKLLPNRDLGVVLREVDPSDYDYDSSADYIPLPIGSITSAVIPAQAMVSWSVSAVSLTGTNGRSRPGIELSWGFDQIDDVDGVLFDIRLYGASAILISGETPHSREQFLSGHLIFASGLSGDTEYEVRGRYRPISNRTTEWSDWLSVTTDALSIVSDDLADALLTFGKFAAGLTPVQQVDDLGAADASEGAVAVLTTDGKLYRYHSGAWTAAVPTTDLSGEIDTSLIADAAVTTAKINDAAVAAAKLAANAVTSPAIAAGAVIASKMFIGSTDNLILDGQCADVSYWTTYGANIGPISSVPSSAGFYAPNTLQAAKTSGSECGFVSKKFQVEQGKSYYFSAGISIDTIPGGNLIGLWVSWLKSDGTVISGQNLQTSTTGSAWVDLAGSAAAPSTACYALIEAYATVNCSGTLGLANPYVRKMAEGNLVVDGSITTNKLNALAVTADKLAANSVTASKISIGSMGNLVLDGQCIEHDYWAIYGTGVNTMTMLTDDSGFKSTGNIRVFGADGNGGLISNFFGVENGRIYLLSCTVYAGSGFTGAATLYMSWYDANQNFISNASVASTTGLSYQNLSGSTTAPSNATYGRFLIYWTSANSGNSFYLGNPYVRLVNDGQLIVDGAISADKLAANSVVAGKVAANAITAGTLAVGAINASTIVANDVIVTDHLVTKAVTETETTTWSNQSTSWDGASGLGWEVTVGSISITSDGSPMLIATSVQFNLTYNNGLLPEVYIQVKRGDGKIIGYVLLPTSGWLHVSGANYTITLSILGVDIAAAGSTSYTLVIGASADPDSGSLTNSLTAVAPSLTAWYWKK